MTSASRGGVGAWLDALAPNRAISPTVLRGIAVVQLGVVLALWVTSPLKVLPSPLEVVAALRDLWMTQGLGQELVTSIGLNLEALAITLVVSLGLSYATVIPAMRPIVGAVSKGRFLGLVGLTLLFTLTVGGGRPLKIATLVFGMTVFFVTSMAAVILAIPRERFEHARTLRFGEWHVVREVVVLGTAADAFEVLRQNAAMGWMMLTMVEGISRSEGGVGAMLLNQNKQFHLAEVFAIQLVILLVGVLQDWVIGVVKQAMLPYAALETERR